jgi:hypothetical protein
MNNVRDSIVTRVAMFWLNADAAAMKNKVLSKLESETRLAGDEPTSSERHADDTRTATSRLGADYYDVQR